MVGQALRGGGPRGRSGPGALEIPHHGVPVHPRGRERHDAADRLDRLGDAGALVELLGGGRLLAAEPTERDCERLVADFWKGFSKERCVVGEQESAFMVSVGIPLSLQRRIIGAPSIELVSSFDARVDRSLGIY